MKRLSSHSLSLLCLFALLLAPIFSPLKSAEGGISPTQTQIFLEEMRRNPDAFALSMLHQFQADPNFPYPPLAEALQEASQHLQDLQDLSDDQLLAHIYARVMISNLFSLIQIIYGYKSSTLLNDTLESPIIPHQIGEKIRSVIITKFQETCTTWKDVESVDAHSFYTEIESLVISTGSNPNLLGFLAIAVKNFSHPVFGHCSMAALCQHFHTALIGKSHVKQIRSTVAAFREESGRHKKQFKAFQKKQAPYQKSYDVIIRYSHAVSNLFSAKTQTLQVEQNPISIENTLRLTQYNATYGLALPILDRVPLELRDFSLIQSRYPIYFVAIRFDSAYDHASYIAYDESFGQFSCEDYRRHDEQHFTDRINVQESALSTLCGPSSAGIPVPSVLAAWNHNGRKLISFIDAIKNEKVRKFSHALLFDLHHEDRWPAVQESLPLEPAILRHELFLKDSLGFLRAQKLQLAILKGIFGSKLRNELDVGLQNSYLQRPPNDIRLQKELEEATTILATQLNKMGGFITFPTPTSYYDFWGQKEYDTDKAYANSIAILREGKEGTQHRYVPTLVEWLRNVQPLLEK